jgi:hypothetical protein
MSAFISYSSKDLGFVRLLVKLLEFHDIEYWFSTANLKGGDRFAESINQAIANVDVMLVIVSANSINSPWVPKEIGTFQKLRPGSPIVPLLIDDVSPDDLSGLGLAGIQYVDFAECLLHGFECLFKFFNKSFLPPPHIRGHSERRKTATRQRLRYGFWLAYHDVSGLGKFEPIELAYSKRQNIRIACTRAASGYTFRSRAGGAATEAEEVVNQAIEEVCNTYGNTSPKAIYVIEGIAESIWERFEVTPIDRRSSAAPARTISVGTDRI